MQHSKIETIAAYCRVSTETDEQLNSLENQKQFFHRYAEQNGYHLTEIYADEGISGTNTTKRAAFHRMVTDASLGKFQMIVTKEVSRFARNAVDALKYVRQLEEIGVSIYFMNDNINTHLQEGELHLGLMSLLAQEESRKTSERVKWGQRRQMERGVVFGRAPLGFHLCNGVLTINDEEAHIIRLIFDKYLLDGMGVPSIAKFLENQGIRTKNGNREWTNKKIYDILRNEKYCGDLIQQKTFTPDFKSHKKKRNRGEKEFIAIRDHHQPIISRDTFEQVQNEIKRRAATAVSGTKYTKRYPLSGKIKCACCGHTFVSRKKHLKSGEVIHSWMCSQHVKYGSRKYNDLGVEIGCDSRAVRNDYLITCLGKILGNICPDKEALKKDLIGKAADATANAKTTKPDARTFQKKIEALKIKKEKAINAYLDEAITREELIDTKQVLNSEISKLKARIAEANRIYSTKSNGKLLTEPLAHAIERYAAMPAESSSVCTEVVDHIICSGSRHIDFRLRGIDGRVVSVSAISDTRHLYR